MDGARANSWTIHEFGRVLNAKKAQKTIFYAERRASHRRKLSYISLPLRADGARANSWTIHEFGRVLNAKKRQVQDLSFFGAEDEIRTRATVSHTTPLAGEHLEPLGYFCIAQFFCFIQKLYYYSTFFFTCQSFLT